MAHYQFFRTRIVKLCWFRREICPPQRALQINVASVAGGTFPHLIKRQGAHGLQFLFIVEKNAAIFFGFVRLLLCQIISLQYHIVPFCWFRRGTRLPLETMESLRMLGDGPSCTIAQKTGAYKNSGSLDEVRPAILPITSRTQAFSKGAQCRVDKTQPDTEHPLSDDCFSIGLC